MNDLQPPKPFVKPSIFVLGPSKSGKTIAAERLSKELDLVYLTIPIIIQGILDGAEDTDLYDNIKSNLLSGNSIPEDLIVEAVSIITKRGLCQAKGWVLDGYPYTHEQASELECHGVIPHLIFNLDVDQDEMINRCGIDLIRNQQDNIQRVDEGIAILRNQVYTENIEKIKTLYNDKYSNWISIDKNCSKWATFNIIKQEVESSIIRRQLYILKKHQGKAARIWGIGVNNYEIKSRMSPVFLDYCSVTLKDKMEIVKGAEGTRFMSEYSELYYNMSSQDALDSFMGSPDRYVDGVLPELPARAKPEEVTDPFPEGIELKGYCPVTLSDGPVGFESIHFGGRENVVIYKDKKYAMLNAEKAERFMRYFILIQDNRGSTLIWFCPRNYRR